MNGINGKIERYLNCEGPGVEAIIRQANLFRGAMVVISAVTVVFSPIAMGAARAVDSKAIELIENNISNRNSSEEESLQALKRDRRISFLLLMPGVTTVTAALLISTLGVAVGAVLTVAVAVGAVVLALIIAALALIGAVAPFYGIYKLAKLLIPHEDKSLPSR